MRDKRSKHARALELELERCGARRHTRSTHALELEERPESCRPLGMALGLEGLAAVAQRAARRRETWRQPARRPATQGTVRV